MAENKAQEFFGMDFRSNAVSGETPAPEPQKGIVQRATEFFGSSFRTEKKATRDTGIQPITKKAPSLDFDQIFNNLIQAESSGRHIDPKTGKLTRSPVGALGITQIMPATAKKPGFGIDPLRDQSEQEYIRLGRDYLQALMREFDNDAAKALAAYNAGIGNVKKAVEKGGEDWMQFLPRKDETIPYVRKILGRKDGS